MTSFKSVMCFFLRRPGLDYTVAHYGILTKDPRLDCVLTFVDDEGDDKRAAWDSGEVGHFRCFCPLDRVNEAWPALRSCCFAFGTLVV